jgi:hypothetical protein
VIVMAVHDVAKPGSPWTSHRDRAKVLCKRFPFAAQMLLLYLALLDVWEDGLELAREERPDPRELARWTAERILPSVVKATEAAGPEALAAGSRDLFDAGGLEQRLSAWLAGGGLPPVERYLARASLRAPLVALDGMPAGRAPTIRPPQAIGAARVVEDHRSSASAATPRIRS